MQSSGNFTLPPPGEDNYEVGYKKTPADSRFKKGQSGNPKGRKKGSKNKVLPLNDERLHAIILKEAYRDVKVNDGDKQITMPLAQAVVRSIGVSAAKGHHQSRLLFAEMLGKTETRNKHLHDEWLQTVIEYKCGWEKKLAEYAKLGIKPPEIIPHSDDIIVDLQTGEVQFKGPRTKEEKIQWDYLRNQKAECLKSIAESEKILRGKPNDKAKKWALENIESQDKLLAMIRAVIPD